jgi:hypothetical protein
MDSDATIVVDAKTLATEGGHHVGNQYQHTLEQPGCFIGPSNSFSESYSPPFQIKCHVRFDEIWLMLVLMLKCWERKTLFVR